MHLLRIYLYHRYLFTLTQFVHVGLIVNKQTCLGAKNGKCYCPNLSLRWRHSDCDGVSNHQPHGCLLNRLFRRRSKKTSKLRVAGLCVGNSPGPVNSPHKGPVTRKMFPLDDVIMATHKLVEYYYPSMPELQWRFSSTSTLDIHTFILLLAHWFAVPAR